MGSVPQSPESITASTAWSSRSVISHPSVIGSSRPGSSKVLETSGSPSSASSAWATVWRGIPHPDGLLPRVLQYARHLLGRAQDERIAAEGRRLDGPEHRIGNVHELAQLGEVLTYQREVMPIVEVADRPDPRDAVPVAELASQRITGVRRVGDHAARAYVCRRPGRSRAAAGWPDGRRSTWPCDELRSPPPVGPPGNGQLRPVRVTGIDGRKVTMVPGGTAIPRESFPVGACDVVR